MIHRTMVVLAAVVIVSACACFDPRPQGNATVYGRNAAPGIAWFGMVPLGNPPETVGFGADLGVACLTGPAGSEVVTFDGSPADGGQPTRVLGRVPERNALVMWVDVAADGSVTTGAGVPPWWVGDPQECS